MIAFVSGATSGIGKATALKFAKEGVDVIITGRRCKRLEDLEKQIIEKFDVKVLPLCFDVRDKVEVKNTLNSISDEWKNIDFVINNAGLAVGLEHIHEGFVEDWETMIDTNVKGLLYVSRIIMPWLIERKKGHIVNISSIAGKEVYKGGNVYCATKHAVEAITKAMRMELLPFGIKVSSVAPGKVETEFSLVRFKGDKEKAAKVYEGYQALRGEDIAELVWFMVSRPSHVNIADVLILPAVQANTYVFRDN